VTKRVQRAVKIVASGGRGSIGPQQIEGLILEQVVRRIKRQAG
jgi:hypothetical protein